MSKPSGSIRSLEETKQWFFDHGVSVSDWAKSHGFRPSEVYALLSGKTRGTRGSSHRVAVALGLKAVPRPEPGPPGDAAASRGRSGREPGNASQRGAQ
jgi:gp16 family phage-associated protein